MFGIVTGEVAELHRSAKPMKPILPFLAFIACIVLSNAACHAQDAESEAAISAIVQEQAKAWTAGDAAKFSRHMAPEVSFTNLLGEVRYGASDFTARQTEILGSFFKGTTKQHSIRRIRFVTADVAIVDIDNELHGVKAMPAGLPVPPDGIIKTQLMQVFVRRDGTWLVEAFHNVEVKPAQRI